MFAFPQQKFTLAAAWLPSPVLGQGYGIGQPKPAETRCKYNGESQDAQI
jgi:hypothetical protein